MTIMDRFGDSLSLGLLAIPVLSIALLQPWRRSSNIPTFGSPFLPPFINGLVAAIKLGTDEDKFLLALKETYGTIVYIPWPLGQYFISSAKTINAFYATPQKSLSFIPVRIGIQQLVFGSKNNDVHFFMDKFYPMHSRGLSKGQLQHPTIRFNEIFSKRVQDLQKQVAGSPDGCLDIPIVNWVLDAMWDAGLGALFGLDLVEKTRRDAMLHRHHDKFDAAFGLLAGEMIPPALWRFVQVIREGLTGREEVWKVIHDFVSEDIPGLTEGVVYNVVQLSRQEGLEPGELCRMLLGDMWALQANAPFACVALFLRVFQYPGVVERLRTEIEKSDILQSGQVNYPNLNEQMPLMTSCVQETLRLETSAFSIRIAQEDFPLNISDDDSNPRHVVIPKDSKIVAATRIPHLTDPIWGDDPEHWDPDRFCLADDVENRQVKMAKLLKEFRPFGGGVSMCEGRHLALLELKSALTNFIMSFDLEPLVKPGTEREYDAIKMKGIPDGKSFSPRKLPGRPGLGVFQFSGEMNVRLSLRK